MEDDNRIRISTKSVVYGDKDVDEVEITIILKQGTTSKNCSPFVRERALLKHMADSFPSWAEYWMKPGSTLG